MTAIDTTVLDRLREYDTPTICNIIELFEVRPRHVGYMDQRIGASFADLPPMVGFASTATFRASERPGSGDVYSRMQQQVEGFGSLPGPAVVVFQDVDDPTVAATFGEVMCTTYKTFGSVGLITSGAGRDLDQVRAIDYPVFTNGANPSHGWSQIPDVHVPVHVGGLVVHPGDLLHGDRNGVTNIPIEIASEIVDIADDFVGTEEVVLEVLRSGDPSSERLDQARAEGKERAAALRAQVSRAQR